MGRKVRILIAKPGFKAENIKLFGGSILPDENIPRWKGEGFQTIFTPGSSTEDIILWVKQNIKPKM